MERKIVISESNLDPVVERLKYHCEKVLPNGIHLPEASIKEILQQVIDEVKLLRTRKRIERPDGGITIREASRRYEINSSTLAGWLSLGYLAPIKKTPKRTFLLEDEVAYLVDVYKRAPGRGKRTIEQFFKDLLDY